MSVLIIFRLVIEGVELQRKKLFPYHSELKLKIKNLA